MKRGKKKAIITKESQDQLGISRKKYKFVMSLKAYTIIKIIICLAIPVFYFVYSPMLLLLMLCYIGLFFLGYAAEKDVNKSFLRSKRIHIPKAETAIAVVLIVMAIVSLFSTANEKQKVSDFHGMDDSQISESMGLNQNGSFNGTWMKIKETLAEVCTLSTGKRSVFSSLRSYKFSTKDLPDDFTPPSDFDDSSISEFNGGPNKGQGPGLSDVPLEYVFSSIESTVATVLLIVLVLTGLLSLVVVYKKKKKVETEQYETIESGEMKLLSDADIDKILSFGETKNEKD